MIALHAIWDDSTLGRLLIWAESSTLPTTASKLRGRQPKRPRPRRHPFALDSGLLMEVAGGLSGNSIAESADLETLTILLPSTPCGPLPSPELILEVRGDEGATGLMPWNIDALALDTNLALDLLLSLPNQPPHGIAFGGSLRFWVEVSKLSLELVARQCFVPTIRKVQRDGVMSFRASWEAVLSEEDTERVHLLSKAMPPICRAFISPGEMRSRSPSALVLNFLNRTVDASIRGSLSSTSLPPPRRGRHPQALPLPEQWLRALSSDDPTLVAPAEELKVFFDEIHSWLGQIQQVDSGAPFRTCFKLEPPSDDSGDGREWTLSFHLQASDDRSLLVPAERVWRERSGVLTFLKRRFEDPQERLLADLGKASRLFPAIEESLRTARPVKLKLDTEQAYAFLRQSAPLLEQSGFGVLLPQWWRKPTARLGVKLRLKPKADAKTSLGLMGMDSIVAYDWRIALGDETLSFEEFEKLASLKVPLVKVRGQWEEIEKAIAFFKKESGEGEMRLEEALRLGLGREEAEVGLPVVDIEGDGWVKDLLDKLSDSAKISAIEAPATFRRDGSKPGPTLLICPMSIVGNWQREIERFAPSLKVMIHHGAGRLSGQGFEREVEKHDIVITTYSLVHRDEEHLSKIEWECIALDEAQNIKNQTAKQTQAIKRLKASYKVALTGTPVENRLSELWSIMDFLNGGYLGSSGEFRAKFAIPIEKYRDPDRAETLKRLIQPLVLRRLKADRTIIKDLPEKMDAKPSSFTAVQIRDSAMLWSSAFRTSAGARPSSYSPSRPAAWAST